MQTAFSIAVDGLAYGMVLFIISVGLSVTMGLMRVVNLAHGAAAMLGGYFASWLIRTAGFGYAPALLLAVAATVLVALPVERLLFRRIYSHADTLVQVLLTIGVTFTVIGLANLAFGPTSKPIPLPPWMAGSVALGPKTLPLQRLYVLGAGLLVAGGLWFLIERTLFGVHLRAAVDNASMSAALGIPPERVYAITFALSVGLGALGGVLGAELLPIEPYYALRYMVTFLVVVSIGGAGSMAGALAASVLLGLIDTTGKYLVPEYGEFFFYLLVIGIVFLFPHGFSGRARA